MVSAQSYSLFLTVIYLSTFFLLIIIIAYSCKIYVHYIDSVCVLDYCHAKRLNTENPFIIFSHHQHIKAEIGFPDMEDYWNI